VIEAVLFGFGAAASLVLGALVSFAFHIGDPPLGLVMAFGAGALTSAVAYELVAEALQDQEWLPIYTVGLGLGAITFMRAAWRSTVPSETTARIRAEGAGLDFGPIGPRAPRSCWVPCSMASRSRSCWVSLSSAAGL
jgi:hypothetical protein